MKNYHFSFGNSSEGPIGCCARVRANSPKEAAQLLNDALGDYVSVQPNTHVAEIEYIHVYFNDEHITDKDIDEEE